jgi:hypothetical protein
MAWLTREDARAYSRVPREPDMETLSYWLARLEPLIRAEAEGEIIVVFANRCGTEDEATYAGTSAVLGINAGEVKVYGILGRGEKELLVVDTNKRPQAKLVSEKTSAASVVVANTSERADTEARSDMADSASNQEHLSSAIDDEDFEDEDGYDDGFEEEYNDPYGFSPVSPTDPRFPQAYFGPKQSTYGRDNPRDSLISSIGQSPSPRFERPPSPKSRNASRNRQHGAGTPDPDRILWPMERNFGPREGTPGPVDSMLGSVDRKLDPAPTTNISSEPIFPHPVSGLDEKSSFTHNDLGLVHKIVDQAVATNISLEPIFPHPSAGLDSEESSFTHNGVGSVDNILGAALAANIGKEPIFGQFQPHSANSEESSFTHNELGPRSAHVSARPRSTVW